LGKLGRKVCCNFKESQKCILLVKGKKHCIYEETTESQSEKGNVQFGICPLLPQSVRDDFLAEMSKKGFQNFRTWKE
jgi:hypothetical protein